MDTKTKKLESIKNAYCLHKRGNEDIHILDTDKLDTATQNALLDIQRGLETDFDISYEIMADACDLFSDIETIEDLEDEASTDTANEAEPSSVYIGVRLSYLSVNNQQEVSDIMKEYSTEDIATACAIWYDNKVREAYSVLRDYILQ